jgi:hypothetical protein
VERLDVAAQRLHHQLEQAPAGRSRGGERGGDGGVAAPDLAGHGAQARPAGLMVQIVQTVEEHS